MEDNAKSGEGTTMSAERNLRENNESMKEGSIRGSQLKDPNLKLIIDYLENGMLPQDKERARELVLGSSSYQLLDGILYHVEPDKSLRLIPPDHDREHLFRETHSGIFGAHLKDAKIHGELSKHYWWPKMRTDICKWCQSCLVCVTRQAGRSIRPPLTPIPVSGPFHQIGVDIIQFPKSHTGNRYGVVFVDYLTKWPEVFATSDQTALTIAKLFVEQIVCRYGVPAQLLSDRGAAFLSHLLTEICKLLEVEKLNTTAYHPQTDGLVERFNRALTDMLAKKVERIGIITFLLCYLHTELVYRSQQVNHHSICCTGETPGCQQHLDWTVYNRVKLIWILTKGKLLLNFLKPGSWQKRILRKHNRDKRNNMIAKQDYQSLRLVIEFLSICQQLKLVKHTNSQDHFMVLTV